MNLYLYGIVAGTEPIDFGPIGLEGNVVTTLPLSGLAPVVSTSPHPDFTRLSKEVLVRLLLAHQQTLEKVMQRTPVLPFRFGTTIGDPSELTSLIEENAASIASLMAKYRHTIEIDLVATWDVAKILNELSDNEPELIAARARVLEGGGTRVEIGTLLAQALKQRADAWRLEIIRLLKLSGEAHIDHDLMDDSMVMNSSWLLARDRENDFMRGVEAADAVTQGKLNFKCIGPLPPHSFATLELKRFDPVRIREAADLLKLNGRVELAALKRRYKDLSRGCHPDIAREPLDEAFEKLNRAYRLVADYCKEGPMSLETEAVTRFHRLDVVAAPSLME